MPADVLPPGTYLGTRLGERRLAGISLTETALVEGDAPSWHAHAAHNFFLVVSGKLRETVRRRPVEHGPRTFVHLPTDVPHRTVPRSQLVRVLNLQLAEDRLEPLCERLRLADPGAVPAGDLAVRLVHEFHTDDDVAELAIEGLVHELLARLGRSGKPLTYTPPRWLGHALRLVRERLPEAIPLAELATAVGVERTYLARAFRRHTGRSVGELVRAERARMAEELLADPRLSLAQIAARSGFADQSHMTRVFREHYGVTPGRARGLAGRGHRGHERSAEDT